MRVAALCCLLWGLPLLVAKVGAEEEPAHLSLADDTFFVDSSVLLALKGQVSGTIAIGLARPDGSAIRIIDLEQQRILKFAFQAYPINYPAFSPNGEEMAFSAVVDGAEKIFRSRWDGFGAQRVTAGSGSFGNPSWSTTGEALFFYSEVGPGRREIVRASFPDTEMPIFEQLTFFGGRNTTPAKNPSAAEIAYSTDRFFPGWDICFFNLVTRKESCPLGDEMETFCRPDWSSDGTRLLLSKGYAASIDLYIYNTGTALLEQLTSLPFKEYDARFSPDGKFVAFSYDPLGDEHYELWLLRLSDKALFPLVRAPQGSLRYLSWSGAKSYVPNQEDLCPDDVTKIAPGVCGCGVADQDSDADGTMDCRDGCASSPLKTTPGNCGCDQADLVDATGAITCASPSSTLALELAAPEVHVRKTRRGDFFAKIQVPDSGAAATSFLVREKSRVTTYPRRAPILALRFPAGAKAQFAWVTAEGRQSLWTPWIRFGPRKH